MSRALILYNHSIGKKAVMAFTGIVLFLFLIGHLLGNLLVFAGPEPMNHYAEFLHSKPALLWGSRIVLLACLLSHIAASIALAMRNKIARPQDYAMRRDLATGYAARTMYWSGPIVLLYVIYHLLHLTFRVTPGYAMSETDVYANVVRGFQIGWLSAAYAAAILALGLHLFHGLWSLFQTLGLNHPSCNAARRKLAALVATAIVAGYLSIPLAVLAGFVQPTAGAH